MACNRRDHITPTGWEHGAVYYSKSSRQVLFPSKYEQQRKRKVDWARDFSRTKTCSRDSRPTKTSDLQIISRNPPFSCWSSETFHSHRVLLYTLIHLVLQPLVFRHPLKPFPQTSASFHFRHIFWLPQPTTSNDLCLLSFCLLTFLKWPWVLKKSY